MLINKVDIFITVHKFLLAEVDKMSKKMKEVQQNNVCVVSEEYLDDVQKGGGLVKIMAHKISSWGDIVSLCIYSDIIGQLFCYTKTICKFIKCDSVHVKGEM